MTSHEQKFSSILVISFVPWCRRDFLQSLYSNMNAEQYSDNNVCGLVIAIRKSNYECRMKGTEVSRRWGKVMNLKWQNSILTCQRYRHHLNLSLESRDAHNFWLPNWGRLLWLSYTFPRCLPQLLVANGREEFNILLLNTRSLSWFSLLMEIFYFHQTLHNKLKFCLMNISLQLKKQKENQDASAFTDLLWSLLLLSCNICIILICSVLNKLCVG